MANTFKADPGTMVFGSAERRAWFRNAMRRERGFDPAKVDPGELEHGSTRWYLWCEWDRIEEGMEMVWAEHFHDGVADFSCQTPMPEVIRLRPRERKPVLPRRSSVERRWAVALGKRVRIR